MILERAIPSGAFPLIEQRVVSTETGSCDVVVVAASMIKYLRGNPFGCEAARASCARSPTIPSKPPQVPTLRHATSPLSCA